MGLLTNANLGENIKHVWYSINQVKNEASIPTTSSVRGRIKERGKCKIKRSLILFNNFYLKKYRGAKRVVFLTCDSYIKQINYSLANLDPERFFLYFFFSFLLHHAPPEQCHEIQNSSLRIVIVSWHFKAKLSVHSNRRDFRKTKETWPPPTWPVTLGRFGRGFQSLTRPVRRCAAKPDVRFEWERKGQATNSRVRTTEWREKHRFIPCTLVRLFVRGWSR